jgi:hypothetical protein
MKSLLTQGNDKLGASLIWAFSIPAVSTCPGKSKLCEKLCYATKRRFKMPQVQTAYARNLHATKEEWFTQDITSEIRLNGISVVRIHVSGDFYSSAYVNKWIAIAKRSPKTTFFTFTRSWHDPKLLARIRALAALPNVHMWYSEDFETGPAPSDPGIRRAYMLEHDAYERYVPPGIDLVFRVAPSRPAKRMQGKLVCPYEQKIERKVKLTCDRCRICFTNPKNRSNP